VGNRLRLSTLSGCRWACGQRCWTVGNRLRLSTVQCRCAKRIVHKSTGSTNGKEL